jgi:hypothetical protein
LRYELQKSGDGQSFVTFANVKAKGSSGTTDYERVDTAPLPTTYYRLRMVSRTDSINYTGIVKIVLAASSTGGIRVFPNPVTGDRFALQIMQRPPGIYFVALYNSDGKCLQHNTVRHAGGTALYTIPLVASVASGACTLDVKNGSGARESIGLQIVR